MAPKKTPDPRIVFLDIETTGLSPERDTILEVGMVVTTPTLTVIGDPWANTIYTPAATTLIESDYVRAMHTTSGLLVAVESGPSMAQVESAALALLRSLNFEPGTATMAGYSPHFDRGFLRRHMPSLDAFFDHRMIDVSTLRGIARRLVDPDIDKRLKGVFGEPKHRSIADCISALTELDLYYQNFLDPEGLRKGMQDL